MSLTKIQNQDVNMRSIVIVDREENARGIIQDIGTMLDLQIPEAFRFADWRAPICEVLFHALVDNIF